MNTASLIPALSLSDKDGLVTVAPGRTLRILGDLEVWPKRSIQLSSKFLNFKYSKRLYVLTVQLFLFMVRFWRCFHHSVLIWNIVFTFPLPCCPLTEYNLLSLCPKEPPTFYNYRIWDHYSFFSATSSQLQMTAGSRENDPRFSRDKEARG